jgi:3'-phosphoadenosine 5'-phosphosulfate sulfotransferase (PAPS reductase)/FAD synthetase
MDMRTEVLSYGGGVQTVAMVALVLQGKLPRPDMIVIADTGREKQSTWDYMDEIVQPALQAQGMTVEIAPHSLSYVDLYAHNGDLLLPVYTTTGKLPTFCSTEWKKNVIKRYLRSRDVDQANVWVGFSLDEKNRVERAEGDEGWYQRTFPLYDYGLTRADCRVIIEDYGWPIPPSSACWMCPNMDDPEWQEMKENYPSDFAQAIELEKEVREWDGEIFLHSSRKPLAEAVFDLNKFSKKEGRHQCSMFCMI